MQPVPETSHHYFEHDPHLFFPEDAKPFTVIVEFCDEALEIYGHLFLRVRGADIQSAMINAAKEADAVCVYNHGSAPGDSVITPIVIYAGHLTPEWVGYDGANIITDDEGEDAGEGEENDDDPGYLS